MPAETDRIAMFDPAILLSLEASSPPQPPQLVHERTWLSPAGEARQRVMQRLTEAYSAEADRWVLRLDAIKAQFEPITPAGPATPQEVANLDELIEEFEFHADARALLSARFAKRARREVKALFRADPSLAAVSRSAAERIVAIDKRIVDAMLDYALFLRALRAEGSGEAEGGPVFDSPEALKRYADSLAA